MLQLPTRLYVRCAARASELGAHRTGALFRSEPPHDHDDSAAGGHDRGLDRGQATTEYALVMLGAAVVALLVVAWATAGGGAGKIGRLFDRVIDAVTSKI